MACGSMEAEAAWHIPEALRVVLSLVSHSYLPASLAMTMKGAPTPQVGSNAYRRAKSWRADRYLGLEVGEGRAALSKGAHRHVRPARTDDP